MPISALSVAQIRAGSTTAEIGAFSSTQLGGFADTRTQALTTARFTLDSTRCGVLSATSFAWLDETKLSALVIAPLASLTISQLNALNTTKVGALLDTQIAVFSTTPLCEIGALADHEGFYRGQLVRRHSDHLMDADVGCGRTKKTPMRRTCAPNRRRLDQRGCRRRNSQVGKSRRTASFLSQKPRSRSRRVHTADRSATGKRPAIPRRSRAGASPSNPNTL